MICANIPYVPTNFQQRREFIATFPIDKKPISCVNKFVAPLETASKLVHHVFAYSCIKKGECAIDSCVPKSNQLYGIIKGISQPGKRVEYATDLQALTFKEDLPIDNFFSAIQLAEQNL
jgi:hypothetical protein